MVKLPLWHYGLVDSVLDAIGRNAYYIRRVFPIGRNTILIWQIFGWLPSAILITLSGMIEGWVLGF